jgi:hypothetical protein
MVTVAIVETSECILLPGRFYDPDDGNGKNVRKRGVPKVH